MASGRSRDGMCVLRIHSCCSACSAVNRCAGSTAMHLRMRSLASSLTFAHTGSAKVSLHSRIRRYSSYLLVLKNGGWPDNMM